MGTYALTCPTEIVNAPIDVVWALLTTPERWGDFYDIRDVRADPPGHAVVGQKCRGESGPRIFHFAVRFEYLEIDEAKHRLVVDVTLPLGMRVREDLDCIASGAAQCRVNYHCAFTFADGLRGRVVRALMGRELEMGPRDSLMRLKRAAERASAARS